MPLSQGLNHNREELDPPLATQSWNVPKFIISWFLFMRCDWMDILMSSASTVKCSVQNVTFWSFMNLLFFRWLLFIQSDDQERLMRWWKTQESSLHHLWSNNSGGKARSTTKSILQSSSQEYVVVITNCHSSVHGPSTLYPAKDWNF